MKPYAGKIIVYKSQRKLFFKESEKAFLLYPDFPDIKIGMIPTEEFRRNMEIGFRIGLFELAENVSISLLGSPNPLLTTACLRFNDIGIRMPTLSELQTMRDATKNRVAAFFETAKGNNSDDYEMMQPIMRAAEQNPEPFLIATCEKTLQIIDAQIAVLETSALPTPSCGA